MLMSYAAAETEFGLQYHFFFFFFKLDLFYEVLDKQVIAY